jgi:dynein heavy chain
MENEWLDVNFIFSQYKDTNFFVIGGFDIIINLSDEHITTTQAYLFSTFKKPFEERISTWNEKLMTVSNVIEEWIKCQKNWRYLQPIFDSADIMKQLPAETKKFKSVDSQFRNIMTQSKVSPNVLRNCCREGLYDKFIDFNKSLDNVQNGLNDYLETKRLLFPRFFFLSNDELLDILSNSKDIIRAQDYLEKVFENISTLRFGPGNVFLSILSKDKEKVDLLESLDPRDKEVEIWMRELEEAMYATIKDKFKISVED